IRRQLCLLMPDALISVPWLGSRVCRHREALPVAPFDAVVGAHEQGVGAGGRAALERDLAELARRHVDLVLEARDRRAADREWRPGAALVLPEVVALDARTRMVAGAEQG